MITKQDLESAIAECIGTRNPASSTAIKLAAYYTIMGHLYPEDGADAPRPPVASYSYDSGPAKVNYSGESDFAKAIAGKAPEDVWPVIDDLMSALSALNPRLYASAMRKLSAD